MTGDRPSRTAPPSVQFTNRERVTEWFGRALQFVLILPMLLAILPGLAWHRLTRKPKR